MNAFTKGSTKDEHIQELYQRMQCKISLDYYDYSQLSEPNIDTSIDTDIYDYYANCKQLSKPKKSSNIEDTDDYFDYASIPESEYEVFLKRLSADLLLTMYEDVTMNTERYTNAPSKNAMLRKERASALKWVFTPGECVHAYLEFNAVCGRLGYKSEKIRNEVIAYMTEEEKQNYLMETN